MHYNKHWIMLAASGEQIVHKFRRAQTVTIRILFRTTHPMPSTATIKRIRSLQAATLGGSPLLLMSILVLVLVFTRPLNHRLHQQLQRLHQHRQQHLCLLHRQGCPYQAPGLPLQCLILSPLVPLVIPWEALWPAIHRSQHHLNWNLSVTVAVLFF